MKHVLFVCGRNRLRSPTAEQIFANRSDVQVSSAGVDNDADVPLSSELIAWADIIVVMEKGHRTKIRRRWQVALGGRRIVCLDIADRYAFMEPVLIDLLETRMRRHWPG